MSNKSPRIETVKIGTRKSRLAVWQSEFIAAALLQHCPQIKTGLIEIDTKGDLSQEQNTPLPDIGGKGLFTLELENALRNREIDMAVHSLKDLPTENNSEFVLAAIPKRDSAFDVFISRDNLEFSSLQPGACIGTSSIRRAAQISRVKPQIEIKSIRGNIDTRLKKVKDKSYGYDGIILAKAGLDRLNYSEEIYEILRPEMMLPAPGQGALAVQIRAQDYDMLELLSPLHDMETAAAVSAERSFLAALQAGCNTPVAAYAYQARDKLVFYGRCLNKAGTQCIEVEGSARASEAQNLGAEMAAEALKRGAAKLLGG